MLTNGRVPVKEMAIRKIEKKDLGTYFDGFSQAFMRSKRSDYAEIRVFSMEEGVQPETRWLPLRGITYDPKDDLLDIAVEGLDHLIYHPQEVHVDEAGDGVIASIHVLTPDGTREIIELR